ncbi:hypothetical protein RJ639_019553 [Escallonia herrerae]|uniref:Uncharacterized protein n=1 Tax=Escallonia herrerae TaxID=1293975 RepID=A0AA88V870_9ASTE|nr:hypothetical protein RJ639_019553 [Escallonia herrerae]
MQRILAGDGGMVQGSCSNRKESKPLNSKSASLFLQNYFPSIPVQAEACKEHSAPLVNMIGTCYKAEGNAMPNFLAVNFYMRSDGGGVFDAVDKINGQTLCGCSTVTACQAGAPFGVCKNTTPAASTTPAANAAGSFSGSVQLTGYASQNHTPKISVTSVIGYVKGIQLSYLLVRCVLEEPLEVAVRDKFEDAQKFEIELQRNCEDTKALFRGRGRVGQRRRFLLCREVRGRWVASQVDLGNLWWWPAFVGGYSAGIGRFAVDDDIYN